MRYGAKLTEGTLVSRPNRFLGIVKLGRRKKECFIPNPGRMEELLYPGATVFVKPGSNTERRTKLDLVMVKMGRTLVSIDSRVPNRLVEEALRAKGIRGLAGYKVEKKEYTFLNSRFDFLLKGGKGKMLLEAKGCTLVEDGKAMFPDAPTERGAKHMKTLADGIRRGFQASIIFVIQRSDARTFTSHDAMDPVFGVSLRVAIAKGVKAHAYTCKVTRTGIRLDKRIPIKL